MNTFHTLALAAVGLATLAVATPAQAHDRRYRHRHSHGRVVILSDSPRYVYTPRYYRPYHRERVYYTDRTPSVSIAFGGHRNSDWRRHHHHDHDRD